MTITPDQARELFDAAAHPDTVPELAERWGES